MITKEEFYEKYINKWMKDEISVMKDKSLNFPLSLCILSYMDFLGSILYGKNRLGFVNAKLYIEKCFENKEAYPFDVLNKFIRVGLAHEYFAKGGIAKHGLSTAMYMDTENRVVLDVSILSNNFLNSLNNFKTLLFEDKNENFKKRLEERENSIEVLEQDYKNDLAKLPRLFVFGSNSSVMANMESSVVVSGLVKPAPPKIYAGMVKKDVYIQSSQSSPSIGVKIDNLGSDKDQPN